MAVLRVTLVVAMVTMAVAAPVVDDRSTQGELLRLLRKLTEGSAGQALRWTHYPLKFNFQDDNGLPKAYCRVQNGDVDVVRALFSDPFEQVVGDRCLTCGDCAFRTTNGGMRCTLLPASSCSRR